MCWWIVKSNMPTMTREKVIEAIEEHKQIHETYAGLVVEQPESYPPELVGDYDWHMHCIEIYENALYWLTKGG